MKEMTGSGIFAGSGDDSTTESGSANPHSNKTGLRVYQVYSNLYTSYKVLRIFYCKKLRTHQSNS